MIEITEKIDKVLFYDRYVEMCKMHKFPALHIDNIDEVFGYFKDDILIYSCFLWNTGSKMCLLGFPLSNLLVDPSLRKGCLTKFIKGIEKFCKEAGYNIIWTTSATDRVIKALEESGYQKGDENVQTYIKVVS